MVQGVTHRIRLPSVPSNLVLNITKRTQLLLPALHRPALWHRHFFPPSPYHILSYLLCMSSFVFKSLGSEVNRFSSYIQLKHRELQLWQRNPVRQLDHRQDWDTIQFSFQIIKNLILHRLSQAKSIYSILNIKKTVKWYQYHITRNSDVQTELETLKLLPSINKEAPSTHLSKISPHTPQSPAASNGGGLDSFRQGFKALMRVYVYYQDESQWSLVCLKCLTKWEIAQLKTSVTYYLPDELLAHIPN